jgi:5-methyltetrahydrofolate--homocysteine methyltransferase
MVIVGELINASRKAIGALIEAKDADAIKKVSVDEKNAGANYIDVNAGIFVGKEGGYLAWLVKTVQDAVDGPCCIDSPDPNAIEKALAVHKGVAMINSISLEKERYDKLLQVVAGTDLKVVALCMSDEGMPQTAEARVKIAEKLIEGLTKKNVLLDNIYVDPLVQPVSTDGRFGLEFLDAIQMITTRFKGVHTMCGLSNISFGLPGRKYLNTVFATMAISCGLDGLIIDPLDKNMMASLIAAETLAGRDDYCMNYLKAYRSQKFEF